MRKVVLQESVRTKHVFELACALSKTIFATIVTLSTHSHACTDQQTKAACAKALKNKINTNPTILWYREGPN